MLPLSQLRQIFGTLTYMKFLLNSLSEYNFVRYTLVGLRVVQVNIFKMKKMIIYI